MKQIALKQNRISLRVVLVKAADLSGPIAFDEEI
jgi:hypothetical protein